MEAAEWIALDVGSFFSTGQISDVVIGLFLHGSFFVSFMFVLFYISFS